MTTVTEHHTVAPQPDALAKTVVTSWKAPIAYAIFVLVALALAVFAPRDGVTTYRLTELHCGGIPTRVMARTAELQPEAFVEISPELAEELGIGNLDWTVLSTLRGEIEAKALVTERIRPFRIDGRTIHQVGMPWDYGWEGYARGDIANALLAITGDPNVSIHTTKAITCNIRPGRLPQPGGVSGPMKRSDPIPGRCRGLDPEGCHPVGVKSVFSPKNWEPSAQGKALGG